MLISLMHHVRICSDMVILEKLQNLCTIFEMTIDLIHYRQACSVDWSDFGRLPSFKGSHFGSRVISCIILPSGPWEPLDPLLKQISHETSQWVLQTLVHHLCLSIDLGMIKSAHPQLSALQMEKLFPKFKSEIIVSITYYQLWISMQFDNVVHKEL